MYILIELLRYFLCYLLRDNYNKFHRRSMQTERTLYWVRVENLSVNPVALLGPQFLTCKSLRLIYVFSYPMITEHHLCARPYSRWQEITTLNKIATLMGIIV